MSDGDFGDTRPKSRDAQVQTAKIVAAALMGGSLVFLVIALFVRFSGKDGLFAPDPWNVLPPRGMISLLALAMAVVITAMSFVVPKSTVATFRKAIARHATRMVEGRFDQVYMTSMIIGMAMLEGAAFLNGIAFIVEGHIPNLIAAGILILLMAARFPSRAKFDSFTEDQEALLLEDRQAA